MLVSDYDHHFPSLLFRSFKRGDMDGCSLHISHLIQYDNHQRYIPKSIVKSLNPIIPLPIPNSAILRQPYNLPFIFWVPSGSRGARTPDNTDFLINLNSCKRCKTFRQNITSAFVVHIKCVLFYQHFLFAYYCIK